MIVLESIVFPIPADPFFIMQCLKHPKHMWRMAALGTLFSTLGGLIMYAAGFWMYVHFHAVLIKLCGGEASFLKVHDFMQIWGAWAISLKTILPIPYKIMALVSGVTQLPVIFFILASIVGRGLRFCALCFLVQRYHAKATAILDRHLSWIQNMGYAIIVCGILVLVVRYLYW